MSTLYFSKAKSILYPSLAGSVSSLNDTVSRSFETILPRIFGEFSSDKLNSAEVVILCVGIYFGMKSDTAAHNIIIDFAGKNFFISKIPFRYM
jgi:hypothetical protein